MGIVVRNRCGTTRALNQELEAVVKFRSLLALTVVMVTTLAWAGKHPVPLDPKADPSTCVQCHEDKTKGKSVHSAIAMGCTSCHEVRSNRDVTRIKLTA